MRRVARQLAACLILAACSGGAEPQGAPGAAAEEYFPLVEGARWTYALTGMVDGEVEVIARGQRQVRGLDEPIFIMDEVADGRALGFADVAPVGYVRQSGYVGRYLALDYDEGDIRLLAGEDAERILPLDPEGVTEWEGQDRIFELPEGGGGARRTLHRLSSVELLEVPAGSFRDLIVVESQYWEPEASELPILRFQDFYAKGVGLIRSVTYDERQGGKIALEQDLVRYTFPDGNAAGGPSVGADPEA